MAKRNDNGNNANGVDLGGRQARVGVILAAVGLIDAANAILQARLEDASRVADALHDSAVAKGDAATEDEIAQAALAANKVDRMLDTVRELADFADDVEFQLVSAGVDLTSDPGPPAA
jgi:hypothetical protein